MMKINFFLTLFFILVLSGCASYNYTDAPPTLGGLYSRYVVLGYEGGVKALDEVGILTTDGLIKIESINNHPLTNYRIYKSTSLYPGGRFQLHLLPGEYDVSLSFSDDRGGAYKSKSLSNISQKIKIEKHHILHLSLLTDDNMWTARQHNGETARQTIEKDFVELVNPNLKYRSGSS